jgi:hypothetical protein
MVTKIRETQCTSDGDFEKEHNFDVDCIHLGQDLVKCQAFVKTVMNLRHFEEATN